MKRIISIFLLATVNLILLAHSAIPHHHHYGVAVDIIRSTEDHHYSSHSQDAHHYHHHHTSHPEDPHQHDEDPMAESYLLNALSRTSLNNHKNGIAADNYPLTVIIKAISNEIIPQSEQIRHKPYLLRHLLFLEIHSNGLRGPPIC